MGVFYGYQLDLTQIVEDRLTLEPYELPQPPDCKFGSERWSGEYAILVKRCGKSMFSCQKRKELSWLWLCGCGDHWAPCFLCQGIELHQDGQTEVPGILLVEVKT